MPTYDVILASVQTFVLDYIPFFAAGSIFGLMVWGAKKIAKAGK